MNISYITITTLKDDIDHHANLPGLHVCCIPKKSLSKNMKPYACKNVVQFLQNRSQTQAYFKQQCLPLPSEMCHIHILSDDVTTSIMDIFQNTEDEHLNVWIYTSDM